MIKKLKRQQAIIENLSVKLYSLTAEHDQLKFALNCLEQDMITDSNAYQQANNPSRN